MKAAEMKERPTFTLMKQTDVHHMQMPCWLFSDPRYADMSLDAKVAYTFLLNRFQLSRRNGWVNDHGEVFVIRPDLEITAARVEATLRQLRYAMGDIRLDGSAVWLGETQPDSRRLEAVDVMLELAEGRPQDFSTAVRSPELLRFTLEGNSLRLFTVVTLSDPLAAVDPSRPGRTVWISDSGASPPGLICGILPFLTCGTPTIPGRSWTAS